MTDQASRKGPALAQSDADGRKIQETLFSETDSRGNLVESYITHAKIGEVASREDLLRGPANTNSKERIVILAAVHDGTVRMHKAREANGAIQIGRTWALDELGSLEFTGTHGVIANFSKPYFWQFHSTSDKVAFARRVSHVYSKYKKKPLKKLNFDVDDGALPAPATSVLSTGKTGPAPRRPSNPSTPPLPSHQYPVEARPDVPAPPIVSKVTQQQADIRKMSSTDIPMAAPRRPSRPSIPLVNNGNQTQASPQGPTTPVLGQRPYPVSPSSYPNTPNQTTPRTTRAPGQHATNSSPAPTIPPTSVRRQKTTTQAPFAMRNSPSSNSSSSLTGPAGATAAAGSAALAAALAAHTPAKATPPFASSSSLVSSESSNSIKSSPNNADNSRMTKRRSKDGSVSSNPVGSVTSLPPVPPKSVTTDESRSSQSSHKSQRSHGSNTVNHVPGHDVSLEIGRPPQASTIAKEKDVAVLQPQQVSPGLSQAGTAIAKSQENVPTQDMFKTQDPQLNVPPNLSAEESLRGSQPLVIDSRRSPSPKGTRGSGARTPSPKKSHKQKQSLPPANLRLSQTDLDFTPDTPQNHRYSATSKRLSTSAVSPRNSRFSRADIRSPRRSRAGWHSRQQSNISYTSRTGEVEDEGQEFLDLESVLKQLEWSGTDVVSLERSVNEKLSGVTDDKIESIVSLDDKLDELDRLMASSLEDCNKLDNALAHFGLQLASIGDEVRHIEGQGEGIQVVAMNQKALAQELEHLLGTVRLQPSLVKSVADTDFTINHLSQFEASLIELYGAADAVGGSNRQQGGIAAAQEQKETIQNSIVQFNRRFAQFFKDQIKSIPQQSGMARVDGPFMLSLYPYAGALLFVKETSFDSGIYDDILSFYQKSFASYYKKSLAALFSNWRTQVEGYTSKRTAFELNEVNSNVSSAGSAPTGSSLRARAMKAAGSHQHTHHSAQSDDSFILPQNMLEALYMQFATIIGTISEHVSAQYQVFVKEFHLSSYGARQFDVYVEQNPVTQRIQISGSFSGVPAVNGVDSSRSKSQELLKAVSTVFGSLNDELAGASEVLKKTCLLESVSLIGILEKHLTDISGSDQEFTKKILERFRALLIKNWTRFIDEQARLAVNVSVSTKTRVGIVPLVSRFTTYVIIVERALKLIDADMDHTDTRKVIDNSHDQLYRAITQMFERSFQASSQSLPSVSGSTAAAAAEDKDSLNGHVTMIENLDLIIARLDRIDSFSVQNILIHARSRYKTELQEYISGVIHRPLGHAADFLNQVKASKDSKKPKLSAFKKVSGDFESKELRKGVETLRKRVEKHFGEEEHDKRLVDKVWRAIGAEYFSYYTQLATIAKSLDAENLLDISKQDVTNLFR